GCTMRKEEENKELPTMEEVREEMLDYLEDKYGEEFEMYNIEYAGWGSGEREHMLVYPKDREDDERVFSLYRIYEDDGSIRYEDGYVGYVMEPIAIEKYEEIVKKYFPNSIIFAGFAGSYTYPEELTIDSGYDEFKKYMDQKVFIGSHIFAGIENEEEAEELVKKMEEDLKDEFKVANYSFYGYTMKDYEKEILGKDEDYLIAKRKEFSIIEEDYKWGNLNHDYIYEKEKGK
ncbi:MAG TPA: hypothetical protein VK071_07005, partial [Tissierellales bacterium]|nr:hypothetical protein [Tissierellales bacterium]